MNTRRDPEGEALEDDRDCRVLATIVNQEVPYEGERDNVSHSVSRENKIKELEAEIRSLNTSRVNE